MPTVEFVAGQPTGIYYVGVFSDGVFYDSNYFEVNTHGNDMISYNIGDYMVLIYFDSINYYLVNILFANADISNYGRIKVNMPNDGSIEINQIINFSSMTSNILNVAMTNANINNYVTSLMTASDCDYYIFGDMSNSAIGKHNNVYVINHNICVNTNLYQYIQNLLNTGKSPNIPLAPIPQRAPLPSLAPIPQRAPAPSLAPIPQPAPAPVTNDSSSGITTALIIIAVLIILALIIFGGLYFYKKKKAAK